MDRKLGGLIAAVGFALSGCNPASVEYEDVNARPPEADNFMAGDKVMSSDDALRAAAAKVSDIPHASARGACLVALKQTLHDPGSADFGLTSEWPTETSPDGRVHVLPRIRASNGFGALRLATFTCVVESAGGDQMRVARLEQITHG